MPIASISDFKPMAEGQGGVDGTKLPKHGPGGIYHEKQVGSLCAIHAMNNLLQGPLFDAHQLHSAAAQLDREERRLLGGQDVDLTGNARADGFYNVQVISMAMKQAGYELVPLRGEAGKSALKDSAKETGYILNKREHWFSLRRFGNEWFDLNSCIMTPQHYNNADLQHHINEAMREGYDVFVVRGDFPRTALEGDPKALLEAIQGCGRPGQGYSLFAGEGQKMGGAASGGAAAPMMAADLRAARLARLAGGGGSTVPTVDPATQAAPAAPAAAPAAPAPAPAAPAAAPAPAPAASRNPALQQLIDMGFEEAQAKQALDKAGGNTEAALNALLS